MHLGSRASLIRVVYKATLADVDGMMDLGQKLWVSQSRGLIGFDWARARKTLISCISSPSSCVLVSKGGDGEVQGAIVLNVGKGMWTRGLQATILAWVARDGSGMRLFREAMLWLRDRPGVTVAAAETLRIDARLGRILVQRYGFNLGMVLWRGRGH